MQPPFHQFLAIPFAAEAVFWWTCHTQLTNNGMTPRISIFKRTATKFPFLGGGRKGRFFMWSSRGSCLVELGAMSTVLLVTFKALHGLAPPSIVSLYEQYNLSRSLCSSTKNLLAIPTSHSVVYGDCAFSIAAPRLWNSMPSQIRNADSLSNSNSLLKTNLLKARST